MPSALSGPSRPWLAATAYSSNYPCPPAKRRAWGCLPLSSRSWLASVKPRVAVPGVEWSGVSLQELAEINARCRAQHGDGIDSSRRGRERLRPADEHGASRERAGTASRAVLRELENDLLANRHVAVRKGRVGAQRDFEDARRTPVDRLSSRIRQGRYGEHIRGGQGPRLASAHGAKSLRVSDVSGDCRGIRAHRWACHGSSDLQWTPP